MKRPIPKRIDEWAMSSSAPSARRTYDGSREADVHADPEDRAMSFIAIRKDSPSMKENERLTLQKWKRGSKRLFGPKYH